MQSRLGVANTAADVGPGWLQLRNRTRVLQVTHTATRFLAEGELVHPAGLKLVRAFTSRYAIAALWGMITYQDRFSALTHVTCTALSNALASISWMARSVHLLLQIT
jgi:hypothetical protein